MSIKKELGKLWEELTRNTDKNQKDTESNRKGEGMLMYRYLDDQMTRIQYRSASSNQSQHLPTIDIYNSEEKICRKIHVDADKPEGSKP
ncbi:hypothetical protein ACFOPX_01640 [Helicobacter baculiformis]|uniref:Uncharacterized protein n=1 Tax=Helicobacter baculiformis TaxID=427351 RepID=A0ABV7ZFA6_9HELI